MESPASSPIASANDRPADASPPPKRRELKRSSRIAIVVIGVLALVAAVAFTVSYVTIARNFISTDNAQIDGDQIVINAPATGTLTDWRATKGASLGENQVIGRIKIRAGFVQPKMSIRAPAAGIVAVDNGVEGSFVSAGTPLATAYDLTRIYVTARIDETDINDVRAGQAVEVSVDAFPDVTLTGNVREVQGTAAGVFSLFPEANSSGNFQKVTQVIPVKIAITDTRGLALVPGMNVTVDIHRR